MASHRIMITGADGQLGRELRKIAPGYPGFDFDFLTRINLSVDDAGAVDDYFQKHKPVFCINCAAYTAVDRAETEKQIAFRINADAVGLLASACHRFGTKFIHISTDYVFDGLSSTPLKEDDPVGPLNVYGASKLRGEELAFQYNAETVVVRTSWVYSEFGANFVKTMIRLMNERPSISVVGDQIGSPTYAGDLTRTLMTIVQSASFVPGVFHYSNEGAISWYEFAIAIRDLIKSSCQVNPIPSSQYPTPAKRPHYSLLDKSKIRKQYGIAIPGWLDSLRHCIHEIYGKEV